jgi:tRNA(Ile)-lysidine synthase
VARVLERVTATAREHEMFSPGDRVLVAVSGGPDSTCLLYSLWKLRRLFKIELEVFHFDHRLRPDSAKDAQYVRRLAAKLKLPFHLRAAEGRPAKGESVEAWARVERWNAANVIRREQGFNSVALGHTLDDQGETLLIAMLRGGGLQFVSGMAAKEGHYRVRPLLDVRRSEVEAFTRAVGLRPRVDPTNRDTRLLRNSIRLEVIPLLEKATGRDVRETLARTGSLLREDADELFAQGAKAYGQICVVEGEDCRLAARGLAAFSPVIAARAVQMAMWQFGIVPERETVKAILDLAQGRPGRRIDLPKGFTAVREKGYIRISSPDHP